MLKKFPMTLCWLLYSWLVLGLMRTDASDFTKAIMFGLFFFAAYQVINALCEAQTITIKLTAGQKLHVTDVSLDRSEND